MRILHILASSVGGGATHVFDLITYKKRDEIEQRLVIPRNGGAIVERLQKQGYKVEELNITQGWKWKQFIFLIRYIREFQPDVVHCHGIRAGLYGRVAARWVSRKIKTVLTVHGFHLFYYKNRWKKAFFLLLERILQKLTDHVIAVSKTDWLHLLECGLISKEKSQVILNGIRPIASLNRKKARSILNISDPGRPVIATACRLHPQKGVIYFIEAIPYILQRYPKAIFFILGEGPEREELEKAATKLRVSKNICFTGNRNDVMEILPGIDIYVSASLWEGLPLGLLEAIEAEVPIVATDVDGNRDVIEHGKSGLLVPARNSEALAQGIMELLQSAALVESLVKEAKIRLRAEFSLGGMVQKTRQTYTDLIN